MKYAVCGLLAAFLASGVYGDIPTTAKDWYTPSGGFKAQSGTGTIYYGYDRTTGQWQTTTVTVDDKGNIEGGMEDFGRDYDLLTAYQALVIALANQATIAVHAEAIKTIGRNLHDLTSKTGIKITNPQTGQSYTIKFGSGTIAEAVGGSGGDIPATSDEEDPADNTSLDWSGNGKLEIKGWATQAASGNFGSIFTSPVSVPVRSQSGADVEYLNWYGVDHLSLDQDPDTHKLGLKGWRTERVSDEMTPLAEAITKPEADKGTFDEYELVVRNSSKGLNYVALGTLDTAVAVDGESVVTNADGVALYGYDTAEESSDAETPYIPFVDGREHLAWQSVLNFFNPGLFNLTGDGKVNLKGVSADADNLRVMTVSASETGAVLTSSSIGDMVAAPLTMADNKIALSGWDTHISGETVAQRMTSGNPQTAPAVVVRTSQGEMAYMDIGVLPEGIGVDGKSITTNGLKIASVAGFNTADPGMVAYKTADGLEWRTPTDGAPVDGKSVTTNLAEGAISEGEVSLRGFASQSEWAIPYKHGEGAEGELWWRTPDMWCGPSLEWGEDANGNMKFNVAGANDYAGKHAKHYFGTSNDKSASLGWHELPNVTTNRVEGDEATIASTVDEQDPGLKRLGLLGWNYQYGGDPLFVVNAGGSIGYIPLPALTNLAACACTQKWENATAWIGGDAAISEDGGLTLPGDSLDEYMYNTLGYIYSTTPNNLHFDNDGNTVVASFGAPSNWADDESLESTGYDGAYQIKGWNGATACDASVSEMLQAPSGSDATTHLLLAKKTDTGELHYVAIGDGVAGGGAAVDGVTITTNTAHGATVQGVASIRGWSAAANDTYLSKNASGNIEWRNPVPGVDEVSIVVQPNDARDELALYGYSDAVQGAVPMKSAQGLSWLKASSATNLILAGAGINITDNGGGAITISAQAYSDSAPSDALQSVTVVTAVQYDETSHKFQKKTRQITFRGTLGTESGWTDVFEAASHKSEHGVE